MQIKKLDFGVRAKGRKSLPFFKPSLPIPEGMIKIGLVAFIF